MRSKYGRMAEIIISHWLVVRCVDSLRWVDVRITMFQKKKNQQDSEDRRTAQGRFIHKLYPNGELRHAGGRVQLSYQ